MEYVLIMYCVTRARTILDSLLLRCRLSVRVATPWPCRLPCRCRLSALCLRRVSVCPPTPRRGIRGKKEKTRRVQRLAPIAPSPDSDTLFGTAWPSVAARPRPSESAERETGEAEGEFARERRSISSFSCVYCMNRAETRTHSRGRTARTDASIGVDPCAAPCTSGPAPDRPRASRARRTEADRMSHRPSAACCCTHDHRPRPASSPP